MSYQYDLMGVIICWALTGFAVLLILMFCIAMLYYIFSNETKKEFNNEIKVVLGTTKEIVKEIIQ